MTESSAGGSRTAKMGVGAIGVVAVGTLLAILFRGGGGTGSGGTGPGGGTGATIPATQQLVATPARPLKVRIRESDYVVNDRPVDLETLTQLAGKVPPGNGPAVMVERTPSSRAKAENDLRDALTKKGITFASD